MQVITVHRIDFDSMENQIGNATNHTQLAMFVDTEEGTAHYKASEFISNLEPMRLYLGWDKEVYPQIVVKERCAK